MSSLGFFLGRSLFLRGTLFFFRHVAVSLLEDRGVGLGPGVCLGVLLQVLGVLGVLRREISRGSCGSYSLTGVG